MDLQEQLHLKIQQNQEQQQRMQQDFSNMHGSARQSEPSGGISAFHGAVTNEEVDTMVDYGAPTEKFNIADGVSEMVSKNAASQDLITP